MQQKNYCINYSISTHTLTWSVTTVSILHWLKMANFNSHAHVERDNFLKFCFVSVPYFNSHAHVERDFVFEKCDTPIHDFNSHAHVERDPEHTA